MSDRLPGIDAPYDVPEPQVNGALNLVDLCREPNCQPEGRLSQPGSVPTIILDRSGPSIQSHLAQSMVTELRAAQSPADFRIIFHNHLQNILREQPVFGNNSFLLADNLNRILRDAQIGSPQIALEANEHGLSILFEGQISYERLALPNGAVHSYLNSVVRTLIDAGLDGQFGASSSPDLQRIRTILSEVSPGLGGGLLSNAFAREMLIRERDNSGDERPYSLYNVIERTFSAADGLELQNLLGGMNRTFARLHAVLHSLQVGTRSPAVISQLEDELRTILNGMNSIQLNEFRQNLEHHIHARPPRLLIDWIWDYPPGARALLNRYLRGVDQRNPPMRW